MISDRNSKYFCSLDLGIRWTSRFVLVAISLMIIGCGEESQPTATYTGTVSYRGQPLDHGSLRFFGADGRPISAVIQSDGSYKIQLPPATYQVAVTSPPKAPANTDPTDDTPPPPTRESLPARYAQVTKSGLSLTASLQPEPQTWDIELK